MLYITNKIEPYVGPWSETKNPNSKVWKAHIKCGPYIWWTCWPQQVVFFNNDDETAMYFFKVSDGWTPYCMYIISLGFSFLGKNSECKRSEGFHTINIKMMDAYIIYMSTWIFGEIAPLSGMNGELTSAFDIFIHCPCIFFCTSLTPLSAKLLFWQC